MLVVALAKVLDRVDYWLARNDHGMAVSVGGIVGIFMAHPDAVALADDAEWRTLLARWRRMRGRVGTVPALSADQVVDLASTLLVEATREVEHPAGARA